MKWNRETWGSSCFYDANTDGLTRHAEVSPRAAGHSWHLFEGDLGIAHGWAATRETAKRQAHKAALARGWEAA